MDTDQVPHEIYQKLVTLSEGMIERNTIIEIIGDVKGKSSVISSQTMNVLTNKYLSKIALIDKQLSRVATGLNCSVCQELLSITDEILACIWCGSPAHKAHLIKHVKDESYCPACGEYLRFHFKGSVKTVAKDPFKTCVYATSDKIHKLEFFYGEKPLDKAEPGTRVECPECKRLISQDWKFCRYCGARLEHLGTQEIQMSTCPRCGRQIKSTWRFCKMCGHPIASE